LSAAPCNIKVYFPRLFNPSTVTNRDVHEIITLVFGS
jgi:hypothetical protein